MDNPIRFIDSTGNQPGGGDDPTTFYTQYIQNEYNSIWNSGANFMQNLYSNVTSSFNSFAKVAVPIGDAVSQNVAFWGSAAGGAISLSNPELAPLGVAVFEGANAFAYGVDVTTLSITGMNEILNPSKENLINVGFHALNVGLDIALTPALKAAGEGTLLKELFEVTPIKSQLLLP